MREILFRGKTLYATGEQKWVYGNLCHDGMKKGGWCIEIEPGHMIGVDPNTVGQYTGLTDEDKNKIFEHDIVKFMFDELNGWKIFEVYWKGLGFGFGDCANAWGLNECQPPQIRQTRVIGNVFDNPELIPHD